MTANHPDQRERSIGTVERFEPYPPVDVPIPFSAPVRPSRALATAERGVAVDGGAVHTLGDLADRVRSAPADALDVPVHSGHLETWLRRDLGNAALARDVAGLRAAGVRGERLRSGLYVLLRGVLDSADLCEPVPLR